MKSMLLIMSLLMALTVFASYWSVVEEDREAMARKAELARTYGHGQPEARAEQFEAKLFEPDSVVTEREDDLAKALIFGVMSE